MLELKNVSRNYGTLEVLKKVNLKISFKDKLLISGINGAGKSTLLSLISGELLPSKGEVSRFENIKTGIFYDRDIGLFPHLTGQENLDLFNSALSNKLKGNKEKLNYFMKSKTFEKSLNQKFYKCSNGMKKLLLLYISQLHSPDLILLDEPFTKLDKENKNFIFNFFKQFYDEKAIVIMSHLIPDNDFEEFKKMNITNGELC